MARPRIIKHSESRGKKFLSASLAVKRGFARETLLSGRYRAEKEETER